METLNITAMHKHESALKSRKADIVMFQEHAMDSNEAAKVQARAKGEGWSIMAGPCDPDKSRRTGGVGRAGRNGRGGRGEAWGGCISR